MTNAQIASLSLALVLAIGVVALVFAYVYQ